MEKNEARTPAISLAQAVGAIKLHIEGPESPLVPTIGVSDINVLCPNCGKNHSSRRLTLNLDYEKNVFGCSRCKYGGGVYKLIATYTGWPDNEVRKRVEAGELGPIDQAGTVGEMAPVRPLAPLAHRHEVYSAMLDLLTLSDSHRQDLRNRGLSNETIDVLKFKTYPKFVDHAILAKKLMERGLDLRGVPGFGIEKDGKWALTRLSDGGYFIPIRNGRGLIMINQVRFDHPSDRIPKYGYLSSKAMDGGTEASSWAGWAGADVSDNDPSNSFDVILIEGPLKAYIVHELTGANLIAVPGVNALVRVPGALQELKARGMKKLLIAYDMDSETNEQVNIALNRLRYILNTLDIPHETMKWDSKYKGLDDWCKMMFR